MTLSMIGFGLSRQFWSVVLARCAEGALCGNIGVTKGMVAELTDSTNMAQGMCVIGAEETAIYLMKAAFAFLPVVWAIGSTIG